MPKSIFGFKIMINNISKYKSDLITSPYYKFDFERFSEFPFNFSAQFCLNICHLKFYRHLETKTSIKGLSAKLWQCCRCLTVKHHKITTAILLLNRQANLCKFHATTDTKPKSIDTIPKSHSFRSLFVIQTLNSICYQ